MSRASNRGGDWSPKSRDGPNICLFNEATRAHSTQPEANEDYEFVTAGEPTVVYDSSLNIWVCRSDDNVYDRPIQQNIATSQLYSTPPTNGTVWRRSDKTTSLLQYEHRCFTNLSLVLTPFTFTGGNRAQHQLSYFLFANLHRSNNKWWIISLTCSVACLGDAQMV